MLLFMQFSIAVLSKKAVKEALKGNWKAAIQLNTEILERNPKDLDAKVRLGRAYIQIKEFEKAKKIFKDVLKEDPINAVAQKNLEMAKNRRAESSNGVEIKTKALLKEPGTTTEVTFNTFGKFKSLIPGENIILKTKKKSIDVYKENGKRIMIGSIEDKNIVQKLNHAEDKEMAITAHFIREKDKRATIIIKCSEPIFKADRQDIRPYIHSGAIDEPELETGEAGEEQ